MRMPAPLKLVHYTGSDKLVEVMAVCPKIRTFKLFVTESLLPDYWLFMDLMADGLTFDLAKSYCKQESK